MRATEDPSSRARGTAATDYLGDGFAGPFVAVEPNQMEALRPELDRVIASRRRGAHIPSAVPPDRPEDHGIEVEEIWNAQLHDRVVFDLATHPAVLAEVARVTGPDLLLWRTIFWVKEPGARRIEWHQDTYEHNKLGDRGIVTAWIAIDDVPVDSAVQMVAGSQQEVLPSEVFQDPGYVNALQGSLALPPPPIDADPPIPMTLRAGSFFVFNQLVVHGSPPNTTNTRRVGLAARFVPTDADTAGMSGMFIRVGGRARPQGVRLVAPPPRWEWARRSRVVTKLRLGQPQVRLPRRWFA
jgi:non-haem Fe2+, alpha-ketoglutarate-dependent halogenase